MTVIASPYKLPHPDSSSKIKKLLNTSITRQLNTHVSVRGRQEATKGFFSRQRLSTRLHATLNSPRGFGTPSKKPKRTKQVKPGNNNEDDDEDDDDNDDDDLEEGVIPEIVTNRMISRMALTVGVPLFIGLLFFPLFYYMKVGLKIDVPTWVPFIVSFVFFGTALLGVSYGIVSSSWDPSREGSVLGWNEARKNWPVFWQAFRGQSDKR